MKKSIKNLEIKAVKNINIVKGGNNGDWTTKMGAGIKIDNVSVGV